MDSRAWTEYLSEVSPTVFHWMEDWRGDAQDAGVLARNPSRLYDSDIAPILIAQLLNKADVFRSWLRRSTTQDPEHFRHLLEALVPEARKLRSSAMSAPRIDRCLASLLGLCLDRHTPLVAVYPRVTHWPYSMILAEAAARSPKLNGPVLCMASNRWGAMAAFSSLFTERGSLRSEFPPGVFGRDGSFRFHQPVTHRQSKPCLVLAGSLDIELGLKHAETHDVAAFVVEIHPAVAGAEYAQLLRRARESGISSSFFIAASPQHEGVLALQESGVPCWEFGRSELASEAAEDIQLVRADAKAASRPLWEGVPRLANVLGLSGLSLIWVKDEAVNSDLTSAYRSWEVLAEHAQPGVSDPADRLRRTLIRSISATEALLAPPSRVDGMLALTRWMTPLRARLDALRRVAERVRPDDPASAALALGAAESLTRAYTTLDQSPRGKPAALLQAVRMALEKRRRLIIVCNGQQQAGAVRLHLRERLGPSWDDSTETVDVVSVSRARDAPIADVCIIYGAPRPWEEDVLHFGCAPQLGFLLYPTETARIRWLLRKEFADNSRELHQRKVGFLTQITGEAPGIESPPLIKLPSIVTEKMEWEEPKGVERTEWVASMLSRYDSVSAVDQEASETEDGTPSGTEEGGHQSIVNVDLMGGKRIYVRSSKRVPVYFPERDAVDELPPSGLRPSNLLLLIDGGVRKSLDQMVIERVDHQPQMFTVVTLRGLWVEALVTGASREKDTPVKTLQKLQTEGSAIQEPITIQLWMDDEVIGPFDRDDLERIATIYRSTALRQNLPRVWDAICKLRAVHRNLCRLLWRLLPASYLQASREGQAADEVIDKTLGLTLDDFRDSISIERVERVSAPFERTSEVIDKVLVR